MHGQLKKNNMPISGEVSLTTQCNSGHKDITLIKLCGSMDGGVIAFRCAEGLVEQMFFIGNGLF